MTDSNPYESPATESQRSADPKPPRTSRLRFFVYPALIGAVIGGVLLAPFCRGPGDPGGHSIGAGLGGFAGLFVGVVIRMAISLVRRASQRLNRATLR